MIAVILCAGKGSRLEGLADEIPKTLLPVSGNTTILDTILESVTPHVSEVMIVAGHCKDALIKYAAPLDNVEVHVVRDVDKYNNARSLWSALDHLKNRGVTDNILVANGDTVLHPTSTAALVAQASPTGITLAVDSEKVLGDEEMKVVIDADDLVVGLSKLTDPANAAGEFVGQSAIGGGAIAEVVDALEATWSAKPQDYYEDGYELAAKNGTVVEYIELENSVWTEVDDQIDLSTARSLSWLS